MVNYSDFQWLTSSPATLTAAVKTNNIVIAVRTNMGGSVGGSHGNMTAQHACLWLHALRCVCVCVELAKLVSIVAFSF